MNSIVSKSNERDTYLECEGLKSGDYYLFTHMPLVSGALVDSYNVTIYGAAKCVFEISQNKNILKEVCKNYLGSESTKDI